ncbi:MAG TPA: C-type lectin domain-containing protein [Polyangiaceae bacterium]|nr:C-type lectin domain-containing protein [Polyangiaceae bacterium]
MDRSGGRGAGVARAAVLIMVACGSAESRPLYDAPAPLHSLAAGGTGTGTSGGAGGTAGSDVSAAGGTGGTGGTGGDSMGSGGNITAGSGNAAGSVALGGASGSGGVAGGSAGNVTLGGMGGDGATGGEPAGLGGEGGEAGAPAPPVDCSSHGETAADFDGHCYLYRDEPLTWSEAVDDCKSRDGHLVTISSEGRSVARFLGENAFVWELAHESESWLAATDGKGLRQKGDGTFFAWNDGEPMTLDNWSGGQPNNAQASCDTLDGSCYEHCGYQWSNAGKQMNSVPGWNDRVCDHSMGFVCEWDN